MSAAGASCGVCRLVTERPALWQDDLWHLCSHEPPVGVAGWMILIAKRHFAGPADFTGNEAARYGTTLRRMTGALLEATGALRLYTASLGEMFPHFHTHLVPRRAEMPGGARGWDVFDLERGAPADPAEVERIERSFVRQMSKS